MRTSPNLLPGMLWVIEVSAESLLIGCCNKIFADVAHCLRDDFIYADRSSVGKVNQQHRDTASIAGAVRVRSKIRYRFIWNQLEHFDAH